VTSLDKHLGRLRACGEARDWAKGKTLAVAWRTCHRADWMLWLAARSSVRRQDIVLAACACARTSLKYVKVGEDRPRLAIEAAEDWARGGPTTLEQVRTAYYAASAAVYSAYYAAAAASTAAYVAFASIPRAPDAAATAAFYSAYDACRKKSLRSMCSIVRKHIPYKMISAALKETK
jgi:hypothetical protein